MAAAPNTKFLREDGQYDIPPGGGTTGGASPAPVAGVDDGGVAVAGTGGSAGLLTYVRGASVGQYLSWTGSTFALATPLTAPANPGDNTKVPIVASGDFTYGFVKDAQVDPAAAIAGTKINPSFGAQPIVGTSYLALGALPAVTGTGLRLSYQFTFVTKGSTGTDVQIIDYGVSTADTLQIGGVLPLVLRGVNGLTIRAGGVDTQFGSTFMNFGSPVGSFPNTAGELNCGSNAALATTGALLKITGGAAPGAGSTGGPLRLAPGTGATTNGTGGLYTAGYVTAQFAWNDTGIGFYGAAPLARAARINQITDNSGGAATNAVAAAPAVYAAANFNDINATLLSRINALELLVHNLGLTA